MRRLLRRVLPLLLLLLLLPLFVLGTHLSGASAVDKDVAPVGDVKTDLLSFEQEIGGSAVRGESMRNLLPGRRRRGIFFSGGITGFPFLNWGSGYSWSFSGYPYNYYGSPAPSPGYYGYGSGYYPGYLPGYQKIIIG
ncbi:uncharacterized protein LOC108050528 [Drosophila rhopaloa]|uniref:Uncharacterized protein LOC108050528 n=1 Tax=Drosophila rhopaloa TaxID=1041015 RepID=A0A6P4FJV7_DRORH|nr:uncharacterized protein LOC108050528 [Drosophila rhopaloa]